MTERADGVRRDDLAAARAQGRTEHPRANDDAPMVRRFGPDCDVALGDSDPLSPDFDDHVPVPGLLDHRIPGSATEDVRHVVRTPSPPESDAHGKRPRGTTF